MFWGNATENDYIYQALLTSAAPPFEHDHDTSCYRNSKYFLVDAFQLARELVR